MTTQRRERLWVDSDHNIQVGSGSSFTPVDLLANLDAAKTKVTVVRVIVTGLCYPDTLVSAVSGVSQLDWGIGVVSAEARAAAVVPDPGDMAEFPRDGWLVRSRAVVATQQDSGTAEQWHFWELREDIRSARVVDRGQLFLAGDSSVSSGTGLTLRFNCVIRCLVLL